METYSDYQKKFEIEERVQFGLPVHIINYIKL